MSEDTGEQDLVKALDNVAGAAASVGGVPSTDSFAQGSATQPVAGAVASPFPEIQPIAPPPLQAPSSGSGFTPPTTDVSSIMPTPNDAIPAVPGAEGPLASIKQDALVELRPLVDKLNVTPDEKFDTYLLLIRSTDDTNLIGPAYEAAKQITDETRRASALLDIIKEIDYLSKPKEQTI